MVWGWGVKEGEGDEGHGGEGHLAREEKRFSSDRGPRVESGHEK